MPDMTPDDDLRAFVEVIDVWAEYVLGHKDFERCAAAEFLTTGQDIPALDTVYKGYCAFRSGTVGDATWSGVTRALRTLMSTTHFKRDWESSSRIP